MPLVMVPLSRSLRSPANLRASLAMSTRLLDKRRYAEPQVPVGLTRPLARGGFFSQLLQRAASAGEGIADGLLDFLVVQDEYVRVVVGGPSAQVIDLLTLEAGWPLSQYNDGAPLSAV